jgi:hypothetical protein
MVGKRRRFTENFSANLSAIEEFLEPHSRTTFRHFLARLLTMPYRRCVVFHSLADRF